MSPVLLGDPEITPARLRLPRGTRAVYEQAACHRWYSKGPCAPSAARLRGAAERKPRGRTRTRVHPSSDSRRLFERNVE